MFGANMAEKIPGTKDWNRLAAAVTDAIEAESSVDVREPVTPVEAEIISALLRSRDEVRVVNEKTGGEKGSKLARFDLVPSHPLWKLAELYGRGAEKYDERNWERGYDWSLSYAAIMRHLTQFWQGEDIDPEMGVPHLTCVAWHAFALTEFMETHRELDNRPVRSVP